MGESFNSYTLSPKSRNIATTKSGNTITFSTGPNYLILPVDTKDTKNEEPDGTVNTHNVVHENVVCYSNSVCGKIGTKTTGQPSMRSRYGTSTSSKPAGR